jgi:hypothetical protein
MNGAVKVYHAYRKTNITPISKYAFEKSGRVIQGGESKAGVFVT